MPLNALIIQSLLSDQFAHVNREARSGAFDPGNDRTKTPDIIGPIELTSVVFLK